MSPELQRTLARLTIGMIEYMNDGDSGYTEDDVDRCRSILVTHAETIEKAADQTSALAAVEATVLSLNLLNEQAGGSLIETDQREDICEFIITAGAQRGFNAPSEDITEPWREW